jgi:hypothetical protein
VSVCFYRAVLDKQEKEVRLGIKNALASLSITVRENMDNKQKGGFYVLERPI